VFLANLEFLPCLLGIFVYDLEQGTWAMTRDMVEGDFGAFWKL
jgi:hypothetical protein